VALLSRGFPLEAMGSVTIRGKSAPVDIYRLAASD